MQVNSFIEMMERKPCLLISDANYRPLAKEGKEGMEWSIVVPKTEKRFKTVFLLERLEDSLYPVETLQVAWDLVEQGGYLLALIRGPVAFTAQNIKLKMVNLLDKKEWKKHFEALGGELRLSWGVRPDINPGQWYFYFIVRKPLDPVKELLTVKP